MFVWLLCNINEIWKLLLHSASDVKCKSDIVFNVTTNTLLYEWMNEWPFIPIHIMWTYREAATWKRNAYNEIYSGKCKDTLPFLNTILEQIVSHMILAVKWHYRKKYCDVIPRSAGWDSYFSKLYPCVNFCSQIMNSSVVLYLYLCTVITTIMASVKFVLDHCSHIYKTYML